MILKDDEKILYDDLVNKIIAYTPTYDISERIINKLNTLIDAIINNENKEDNYDDWNF